MSHMFQAYSLIELFHIGDQFSWLESAQWEVTMTIRTNVLRS